MSKKSRINRKEKRLERKREEFERDGKNRNKNSSDVGAHQKRTLSRERNKLFEKHFGKEK